MGIGAVYAIRNALLSGRKDAGSQDNWFDISEYFKECFVIPSKKIHIIVITLALVFFYRITLHPGERLPQLDDVDRSVRTIIISL